MTSIAAVLQLDDEGRPGAALTERLGEALYTSFLEAGPYAEVTALRHTDTTDETGSSAGERLAAAVADLAQRHDVIDVVLSIHTTERDPAAWAAVLEPARGKLRLVYTTACHGDHAERAAWVAAGARTVVAHVGFNNPIVAAPLFLSRWIAGAAVLDAVTEAYREEAATTGVALSLPVAPSPADLAEQDRDPVSGSVPTVTGDPTLRIDTDVPGVRLACPAHLTYDRERGGPLGLLLAATAGRAELAGKELVGLIGGRGTAFPFPVERLGVLHAATSRVDERGRGRLELILAEDVRLKLGHGVVVTINDTVRVIPQRFDPVGEWAALRFEGLSIQWAAFRVRLTELALLRDEEGEGYSLQIAAKLFGLIPWRQTFRIGGGDPIPPAADGPTVRGAQAPA